MGILGSTIGTRNHLWIVREEVKALFRMANQLVTCITLSKDKINQIVNNELRSFINLNGNIFDCKNSKMLPWIVLHSTALRQKCHTSTLFQELDDFLPKVWNRIGKRCLLLSILLDKTCRQQSRNSSFPLILPKKLNRIIDNQSLTVIEIMAKKTNRFLWLWTYLDAGFVMLFRGKKKGSIEKGVSVKNMQHGLAKNTWYPVHFVGSITR